LSSHEPTSPVLTSYPLLHLQRNSNPK
jgi:hypothetical protein